MFLDWETGPAAFGSLFGPCGTRPLARALSGHDAEGAAFTVGGQGRERALVLGEATAGPPCGHHRATFGGPPLSQHVLDPRPARAGRADVDTAPQAFAQAS